MKLKVVGFATVGAIVVVVAAVILFMRHRVPVSESPASAQNGAGETTTGAPESTAAKPAAPDAKLTELQMDNARLRAKVASLVNSTNSGAAESTNDGGVAGMMKAFTALMGADGDTNGGGQLQKMIKSQMEIQVNGQISRMKTRLNLTPDQETQVRTMLTQQMKTGMDMGMKMLNGTASADDIQAAQKTAAEPTDIKTLLTPEQQAEYAKMQVEDRQNNARLMANQNLLAIQGALGLNQDQQDKLYNVFYQSADTQLGGGTPNPDGTTPDPLDFHAKLDKELAAMKDILTPEQLTQYKTMQEQQIALMESMMKKGKK